MDANTLRLIVGAIALAISLMIILISQLKRAYLRYPTLSVFGIALMLFAVSYNLFFWEIPPNKYLWLHLTVLGATILPASIFVFSFEYVRHTRWLSWQLNAFFVLMTVLFQLLLGSISAEFPFRQNISIERAGYLIINLYTNILLFIVVFFTIRKLRRPAIQHRRRYATTLGGIVFPLVVSVITLSGLFQVTGAELMLIAYSVTGIVVSIGIFNDFLAASPLERDFAVETMGDGWIILDAQDRVVDVNTSAEKTLGLTKTTILNQPVKKVLKNWDNLVRDIDSEEFDFSGSVRSDKDQKYYSIRLSKLRNPLGEIEGKLLLWQDITDRRKAMEARQQARDEMFVLLQSITSASSRMFDMKDFLMEAIYQIVYSFQSQHSLIILVEDDANHNGPSLTVAAQYGFSKECEEYLYNTLESFKLMELFGTSFEPQLVKDIEQDPRFKAVADRSDLALCLLIAPMVFEGHLIGVLVLTRDVEKEFVKDEVARVRVVVDEMATFIQSNRKRQISIVAEERKRLVRDLHDSISQNLYGLLTLTEVAQAAVESGSPLESLQYLPRIGEGARQALREMRLFLYQLQPVDLEHKGLVAVLHHRLAAVEGRANIKARLLADDDIPLPPHKELALFYIAQEALNNVLKHARAKAVTINLRKKGVTVALEIVDDGIGFDTKSQDAGGLGLRNMRERVAQVDGKISISSEPGQGTRIQVSVQDDRRSSRPKKR